MWCPPGRRREKGRFFYWLGEEGEGEDGEGDEEDGLMRTVR